MMHGITKLKRYRRRRIKRYILFMTIAGIHLILVTSIYSIFHTHCRYNNNNNNINLSSFVDARSTNRGNYDHHHHHTNGKTSSSSKTKANNINDSIVVSNVLQRHRTYYNNRLPHNRYVYDILQVPHNATIQQIKYSYRTLSRIYHPDKRSTRRKNSQQQQIASDKDEIVLQRIRAAYELLKHDTKRFLYHRHGIIHSTQDDVMSMLYPIHHSHHSSSILSYDLSTVKDLHQWMGYNSYHLNNEQTVQSLLFTRLETESSLHDKDDINTDDKNEERIQNIMLFLIERIRPMIEQLTSPSSDTYEHYMYHDLIQQCDRIKVLPLGPSILRCIGRAYRYEGRRVARHLKLQIPPWNNIVHSVPQYASNRQYQHHHEQQQEEEQQQHIVALRQRPISQYLLVMDRVRHTMRHVKHLTTAAIAGSRVYIQERHQNTKHRQREAERDDSNNADETSDDNSFDNEFVFSDHNDILTDSDNNDQQSHDIHSGIPNDEAMLESLQIDALWKIYKIELDSIVRKACRRLLISLQDPNSNVFLPSHISDIVYQSDPYPVTEHSPPSKKYDGWIVSENSNDSIDEIASPILSSRTIRQQQQQLVANVLIRMGSIMIERSKVGTSWMD